MAPFTKPHIDLRGGKRREFSKFPFSVIFLEPSLFFGSKFSFSVIFLEPILYADFNDLINNMIWNITIIKYKQVFDCCISVQPDLIQKNCFTKDLLTLAKLYPGRIQ